MTLQSLLQTLKTAKRTYPNSVYNLIHCCSSLNTSLNVPKQTFYDVDLSTFHQILSDRDIKSWRCVSIFHLVVENPSVFSFQPNLKSHLSLTLRILSERKFSDAERLLKLVAVNDIKRYQFRCIASEIDEFCCDKKVVARFFNSMLMVYSESGKFDEVVEVFEYMMNKDIKICERICTTHLMKLKECNHMESAIDFFHQMLGSGIEVSVYPLTVIVTALCCNGEITRARELVEEMLLIKGIKPNIITFKSMIDSCTKRWNFEELDLVLKLMEKEDVRLDLDTYKVLIEGYASNGKFEEVERLVSKMHDEELKVETYLYNRIINGYSRLGLVEKAFEVHSRMSDRGVTPNRDTYWALMNGLCRAGKVNEALSFLSELRANEFEIDDAMFITLIEGCYREGMISKALEVIGEMIREGFIPDATLLQKLADRLVEVNRAEAEMMVTVMVKNGIRPKSCPN